MISVVIPAYNESTVIARCINSVREGFQPEELEIIVACNGCVDDTADRARALGKEIKVLETPVGNKTLALNMADKEATGWPRFYVDADVELRGGDLRRLTTRLAKGDVHAVAPLPDFNLTGSSYPVRAYFDIHMRLPMYREGIGGSGVYGLSQKGRSRFVEFPAVIADDCFVRLHFQKNERETVFDCSSVVTAPAKLADLLAVNYRSYYGVKELSRKFPELWANLGQRNRLTLLRLAAKPWLWPNLVIYMLIKMHSRLQAIIRNLGNEQAHWERDESSR